MAANRFEITVEKDGKLKVDSVGGFDKTTHKDADEILDFIKEAMGGDCVRTKHEQGNVLANPHQEVRGGQKQVRL